MCSQVAFLSSSAAYLNDWHSALYSIHPCSSSAYESDWCGAICIIRPCSPMTIRLRERMALCMLRPCSAYENDWRYSMCMLRCYGFVPQQPSANGSDWPCSPTTVRLRERLVLCIIQPCSPMSFRIQQRLALCDQPAWSCGSALRLGWEVSGSRPGHNRTFNRYLLLS